MSGSRADPERRLTVNHSAGHSHRSENYFADLHIHSVYSDGSLTPFEIVSASKDIDLKTISITDHDTVSGVEEILACAGTGLEVIPAVEMSSNLGLIDIHILGYYIDCKDPALLDYLEDFKEHRIRRVKKIMGNLASDGIKLEFEQIRAMAKNCSLGRPHIAEVLIENGYVKSMSEAFARYLGCRSPYYEPKKDIHPKEVIKKIKRCQGVPVLAHAGTLGDEQLIYYLIVEGIVGVEVWHPDHSRQWQEKLSEIALKNGLIMTGGSDFHGRRFGSIQIGSCGCGFKEVEMLKRHKDAV